jgi:hypothetical protein
LTQLRANQTALGSEDACALKYLVTPRAYGLLKNHGLIYSRQFFFLLE